MVTETLTYEPIRIDNWDKFEKFFESKGSPHYCWCMPWRNMIEGTSRQDKADKKASLKSYVENGIPIGLLFYSETEPVAWCSIAPRESHRKLSGDNSLDEVWSVTCFYIKRLYRRQHMLEQLTRCALEYARSNGAKYVEAYPVDNGSSSYSYMGYTNVFDKLGFTFKHKAGKSRNVMTIAL